VRHLQCEKLGPGSYIPLSSEFFPQQYTCTFSTFTGVPQCFLLWGRTWWGTCTWRAPSGNTTKDIQDRAKQSAVKVDGLLLMQDLPSTWTGSGHWDNTHHQCACFLETRQPNICLRPKEWSMNIIKPNTLRGVAPPKLGPKNGIFTSVVKPYNFTGAAQLKG